jgi:hypothetical protein
MARSFSTALLALLAASIAPAQEPPRIDFQPIEIHGLLADTDPRDKKLNHPCKLHRIDFVQGKTYVIDLVCKKNGMFDPYLRLEDPRGVQLAEDDDSGGNLNSRITFKPAATGNYQISATTLNGAVGPYLLKVRQYDPLKENKIKLGAPVDIGDGLKIEAKIDLNDPKSPVRRPNLCKVFSVKMKANQRYVIDMESAAFDAYLHLLDENLLNLAQDDDSGGNLNARIVYRAPSDGTYHILATSLGGGEGDFTLRVRGEK